MTTKTIPEYLENEHRKLSEAQLRTEEEAARILASHPAHHRTAKQPKTESLVNPMLRSKQKQLQLGKRLVSQ
jgi:hypothetical protein